MSVSVQARPFGLLTDLIEIVKDVAIEDRIANRNFNAMNENIKNLMENSIEENKVEEVVKEAVNLISREYTTVFADRSLLIKTLEEHGVENVQVSGESVFGKFGSFRIDCYRENKLAYDTVEENPFIMKISAECTQEEIDNFINDINIEYMTNTQEESYIKIRERLTEQGLTIDEEEILEDNTIVLTVNIN